VVSNQTRPSEQEINLNVSSHGCIVGCAPRHTACLSAGAGPTWCAACCCRLLTQVWHDELPQSIEHVHMSRVLQLAKLRLQRLLPRFVARPLDIDKSSIQYSAFDPDSSVFYSSASTLSTTIATMDATTSTFYPTTNAPFAMPTIAATKAVAIAAVAAVAATTDVALPVPAIAAASSPIEYACSFLSRRCQLQTAVWQREMFRLFQSFHMLRVDAADSEL